MGSELERAPEQDNAPARIVPPKPKTDDWALVIGPIANLAEQVANTDFVPAALRGKPAAVTAAVLFGRELDMPPMQALQQVHVIEGRPSLSAEHLRAMVLAAGHVLRVSGDGGQATAVGRRRLPDGTYDEPVTVQWTLAMAQAAKLTGKMNWQKHPRQMLKARATAELCRDLFPDVTHGLDAAEALQDEDDTAPTLGRADQPTRQVSRARKGADSSKAAGPAPAPPDQGPTSAAAPPAAAAPAPPLPGEEAPADHTPGEGLGSPSNSSPAGASSVVATGGNGSTFVKGAGGGGAAVAYCPHISNGVQCTWLAGHAGNRHSFNDPHEPLTVPGEEDLPVEAELLAEPGDDPELAPQDQNMMSEGDGSPDDLAATATDETWAAAQEAAGGPVEDNDPPISPGALRALGAAFTSLGVKDGGERHHTTSALLGRKVESWKTLTRRDADRLFKAIEGIKTRDELEELVQRAAEEWGASS